MILITNNDSFYCELVQLLLSTVGEITVEMKIEISGGRVMILARLGAKRRGVEEF